MCSMCEEDNLEHKSWYTVSGVATDTPYCPSCDGEMYVEEIEVYETAEEVEAFLNTARN